jgi:Molybdopterin biosynthesis enzyme
VTLIPVEEARKIINNTNFEVKKREKDVDIFQALGKIVTEDVIAIKSIPERSLSAMDGYAIKYEDYLKYGKLRVVGKLYPNTLNIPELKEGETYYVTTGSPLPTDADSVVPIENSKLEGEYVIFKGEVKKVGI